MDQSEALNNLKIYKERMAFVDRAIAALEAASTAVETTDRLSKEIVKLKTAVATERSKYEKVKADTEAVKAAHGSLVARLAKEKDDTIAALIEEKNAVAASLEDHIVRKRADVDKELKELDAAISAKKQEHAVVAQWLNSAKEAQASMANKLKLAVANG